MAILCRNPLLRKGVEIELHSWDSNDDDDDEEDDDDDDEEGTQVDISATTIIVAYLEIRSPPGRRHLD